MMRKLTEQDRLVVLQYLYQEPNYNIFPIGDIEHFGFDTDFQDVYATFDDTNNMTSMLLRYRENGIFYTDCDAPINPYLELVEFHNLQYMSMTAHLAEQVAPQLPDFTKRDMFFCAYDGSNQPEVPVDENIGLIQTEAECHELYDLLCQIDEFGIAKQTRESFVAGKLNSMQMGQVLYVKEDGKMVSTVATTAETTRNAMVVGVATLPDYRNRGYASKLMLALMQAYNNKGKQLCLFYDNPSAGSIYHRLGFVDIGKWAMLERKDHA